MSDVRRVLHGAADLIEDHGWIRDDFYGPNGEFSLMGAISEVASHYDDPRGVKGDCYEELRDRLGVSLVSQWEEEEARDAEDVMSTLRM